MAALDVRDLLTQLGVTPMPAAQRYASMLPTPVAPPVPAEGMGLPFPTGYLGAEMPEVAAEEPVLDETAAPLGAQLLGYTPQPRPDLAAAITTGPLAPLFEKYRNTYAPPQPEPDPLAGYPAGVMGQTQTPPAMNRMLAPQAAAMPRLTREDQRQQMLNRPMSASERILMDRSPAYARPIQRGRQLDAMRLQRGY